LTLLSERQKRYQVELARQKANDALCHDFAVLADPFSKWISEQKEIITKSKSDLEAQLKYVDQRQAGIPGDSAKLEEIKKKSVPRLILLELPIIDILH